MDVVSQQNDRPFQLPPNPIRQLRSRVLGHTRRHGQEYMLVQLARNLEFLSHPQISIERGIA